jgi:hypothetical protein
VFYQQTSCKWRFDKTSESFIWVEVNKKERPRLMRYIVGAAEGSVFHELYVQRVDKVQSEYL